MVALAVVAAGSFSLGNLALRALRYRTRTPLENGVLSTALGLALWCHVLFVLGHAGLFSMWMPVVALSTPVVALGVLYTRNRPTLPRVKAFSTLEWIFGAGVLALLLITFLSSFAPVTGGISNDELCTHLSIPAEWARMQRIAPLPFAVSYMAGNGELLFFAAGSMSRGSGPHLVSWLALVLSAAAVFLIARERYSRAAAIAASAIVVMNPIVFRGASIAFVDLLSSVFVLVPFWLLLRYRATRDPRVLVLAALLAGTGCGVKPTNVVYTATLGIFFTIVILRGKGTVARKLTRFAAFASIVAATAAPWPARTMYYTGSPTYPPPPFLGDTSVRKPWRGGEIPYSDTEVNGMVVYINSRYGGYIRSIVNFVRFPWDLTMHGRRFQIGDSIGTVLLSLLPLLLVLVVSTRDRFAATALGFATASSALIYLLVLPEARYFIPALMLLAPPFAAMAFPADQEKAPARMVCAVLIGNLLFSIAVAVRIRHEPVRAVFDPEFRRVFQAKSTPFAEAFDYLRTQRIENPVVLYHDRIFYYLGDRYVVDSTALAEPGRHAGAYLLDIDYSQVLAREPAHARGMYSVKSIPPFLEPAFTGPDARVYRFVD